MGFDYLWVDNHYLLLQSGFEEKKSKLYLLSLVKEGSKKIPIPMNIEEVSLDLELYLDINFKTLLYEIFSFIHNQGGGGISISGKLDNNEPCSFIIIIAENDTPPLSAEVCSRLMIEIEEENRELLGHHIGLTLTSVIVQYYGGRITIHPKEKAGNEFKVHLPFELIVPKSMF